MNIKTKKFIEATRGAIGTRFSDDEGNLYMPDKIGRSIVTFKMIEGKKLVWNDEGTRKIIIKTNQ